MVHEMENEEVVRAVLQEQSDFKLAVAMPWWTRRGHALAADNKAGRKQAEEIRML